MKTSLLVADLVFCTGPAWTQTLGKTVPPPTPSAGPAGPALLTFRVVNPCPDPLLVYTAATPAGSTTAVQRLAAGQSVNLALPKGVFVSFVVSGKTIDSMGKVERPGQMFTKKCAATFRAVQRQGE